MKKRFIYVASVDFQKAFDSIYRNVLYKILRNNGLSGHLYSAIVSIYSCFKAYVKKGGLCSNILYCTKGLRQGCKLNPILFALYINELHNVMTSKNVRGKQLFPDYTELFCFVC